MGDEVIETTEQRSYEPGIHRLRGELLLLDDDTNREEVEACFHRAFDLAERQAPLAFSLRAAISLTRLLADTDRQGEGRALLAGIHGRFTEGYDSVDLIAVGDLIIESA